MATETYIPEFVSISKGEGEEKNLRYMQLDATADENYPGELKKAEEALNDPSENFEYSEKTENMQVANIGIETVSTVNKGHEGTSEGESFLESPSVFKVTQLPISMHKGNNPEAEEKEHESDEGKKIPSDGTRDVTMTTVAASTGETTLQEAGVTFKEKSQDAIVLHEKVKDVILVEGEIQDQNKLDTPFVGQIKDLGLLEVDKPETLKEESESGTDMKEIPDEKNLPQVDLNEKIESEDAEILNKNSNELLVSYPSVEAVQVEGDKPDDISEVEPQEQVHETNGVPLEEKRNFEVATEAYKSTESLILEPTSTEGEKASNTYAEAIDYGLDTEKESKEKNVGQSIEEEIQKKEEACDPEIQKSATRSIGAEESKMDEDVSAKVSDTTGTGNETIQKSFQGDYLDEAPSALTSEGKSDKAKDDAEKDNITSEEVHDEIKITGTMEGTRELIAGEGDVIERLPESIREEKVKSFQDNEKVLLADEKSRGQDNKEQTIADNVKGTPESIKEQNFTDNENEDEKCREEIFVSSEKEKILDTSMVKPKESLLGEGENQVPIDASTEEQRDEHRYSVMDEDNDDKTGLVEVQYDVKDETTIVKENTGWISQKDETGEKLEQSFTVMSKGTETVNSSEYTEKITRIEEDRAIQDIEETFEKEEKKDTKNSEERGTASEEDLKPVAVASEINKSTESADLELKSEKGEMEVEKLERGNDLGSEERFKGNDAREEIEEETKKEETYQADLHKVETTCDDTEKSKIEEDALIKDASTVWIEEERVELSCQEDEDGRNGRGKAALELNDGDHNVRTDNETESSTDPIISEEIAAISQGTVKHIIKEEQTTIDISPQSSGEETHKSSQEDETKEEEPKTEMCEGETTTVGEGAEGQILEGDTIRDHSTVPTEVEETEDFSKYNEMMAEMPKPEVCETISACQYRSTEFIEKDTESPQEDEVCKESEMALTSMEAEKQEIEIHAIPDLSFSTFGGEMVKERSAQEFDGSIKECADVEQVAVELETEAQCIGREASDTKTNCGPTEENKTSVDPGEKLEGAPESVAKDQSNETFLEMNQTQDAETSNNVQDQKSESVVEEQNIEQGLQEDEKNKYEEAASGSEASDHVIQNENETISERAVDFSHSISEVSEEISKPVIQEAETCCNKLDTASKKVETEATCSWEAQPDEKPLKGTESTSEEKSITTGETSPQGEEGESMKLEEATEFMSKLPAIPGENADKESSTMEKSHVDEVEETKDDSETVSESKEQCVEEIDGTQKSLTVEESEGIIKEEIKGPSETVSGCNYQVVESVIEDEIKIVQTATTGESKEQHQETSKAPLPKEQDDGIIATINNLEDGKMEEGETTQKENLEDSFATRTSEEICLHKEEPRELESGLGIKLNEKIQNINPDEPPKEECITLDGVSQLEPQENVSAIKCSDSPTESDKVMELSEEVLEGDEKAAEESEDIKEQITEKDTDVKECLTVSPGDELVNKVQHSETIFDENSRATDSKVQIEQVNLEVMEDLSKDHEGSSITKAMEEEMLQKQGSERQVDVSSFVSEISEGINKEVIEDTNICSNNIDTASEKVETEDTRLQEIQLDDKHIKTIETGSDDKTLQTNTTPETSPQSEAVDSVKLEETPEGVSRCPVIACENTDKESEIVEKPHIDDAEEIKGADVEEIKGASESVSESIEQHVEGNDEIQKNLIVEESEEGIIKEEIKGSSKTGSRCSYQGVKVVIEDEVDVVHTATEEQHQETSKALLSEEQNHGITTTAGHLEDGKAEGGETPQNEDLEDSFATGTTEEICLQKEEPRKLEIFGLGLELNENIQNVNPNEPQKEECITLNEVSQIEPQCSDSPTESDKVPEMPAEVPEGAEKAAEESEIIKELIIEKERDIKECPAVSNEDESVKKAQYSETVSDDNPRATDSEVQTEKMNQEVVEDFSNDSEESPATKAMEEEILQKQGSGKKVDLYSCVSEISEAINKVVIDDADTCSNNSDTASQKVETEETRLLEAQMDDKHIKIIETSSEDEILQTNIAIETSPLGEEVENIKHEEAPEGVSQLPAVTCENTDDSETVEKPQADEAEEVQGASEIVSESRKQFSEENDGILKSLTVEESESIMREEIRGSSETVSGCNYEGVEAVVEDEMDVSQTATTRKSEEQHQETSRALLSADQDCGIIATIGCSEDGNTEEVGTPQNENLEDSKITEETCLQKEEPRELEISGVGIELCENIQNINPNEPPKEECVTLDEVSQLETQENVSAIKCSDSPTKSDKVMEFSEEVLEVEKATEESEDIKKLIIEKERNVKECPAISIGDESVNKASLTLVLPSEIVSDENARSTDYKVQAEKVNLQVVEDFSKDPEGSPITKAMEEEMLRMQGSEKKIDISSSVSEISEEINKEVVDACSYNIDTASEKVETEDTSLQEAQLDDLHIEIIETDSETMQLQRNITTETSPHGEEVESLKHEETPEVVSQLPAIACENKDESEPVEKPHTDEVEEVKEASSTVYECKERCVEEIDETQKSQIVEGSEKGIIKEEIKGPSETVSVCNYEGVDVVIEDEIEVVQAATTGKSEESHHETSTVLLFKERDHGITTTTGHSEDGITKEDGKIEKASAVVFEAHGNVIEKTAVELDAGAYSHGNEASSLKTIDSLTEEALEEAAESENIKKLIIEKEAESEEPAIEDESANKVQHSDTVPSENLGATDPNIQTEKANLVVVDDFSQELEGTPIEKGLEEGKPQIQGSEKTVDISNFVSEISAETAKEVVEDTDACHDKVDTAYEKAETEETSLQEAQLKDKHIKIIETSSEDMKLQTNTTIETSPQGEEVDSVKLEETSTLVSQLPAIACENADKESEAVEKPARDEVEETKGASDIKSVRKEERVEVIDETQKNPTVEESKDLFIEEIKGPSETVSQSKYQGVEAISEEKNIAVETAIAGESEKQHQETSDSLLYEEQDHGISITVGHSEDGKTKEDETLQNENLEDSFATKKADYMHLQMEEHRELEISGLGLELNENLQKNNRNEPQKEGCSTIDEVSPLDAQENVSLVKCTNSLVESDKVMELTKEVPEEAEKAVERENIKELIIDKDREIKELPAVSIDESVNKVQVQEPVSSENLGVTNPNMQTENLILEVEDLSKEPEGSPITKALEEVSEKQNDQKAMDVPSSVSEMKENIKEEIVEKVDISYCKLDTESEKGETEESSLQEAQLDDKPLEIIETSSEDKILQTNNTTETSQQTEEVDCMKLEETLELVSQLPPNGCESTNKEGETVEKPNADELEEIAGASDKVPQSKEQCAEEIDENQKSLALEKSDEDIIKEQIERAFEMESELKYQGAEAVIEEEIIAGQAIKAEVPEEQLEEVSTAILSEEQEHGIHTTIGKSEDENIKEGATGQYENPEYSFGTKMSEEICLQEEEPRELDVSGPKEDGIIVDGVSQYELQENASELKCKDSPLGSEKVMEQISPIGSTHQEATKDDENDSGVVNNNPDVLTHSPGEEISQEEGEKCEEASNLECEHYEKASEPVSDLESAAIDEAVVGLEVGAHIHGSDASNTKNSENLREEVPQGAEEAVESENIKELIIETERDIKDLPAVAIEDGTDNKAQHAEAVSNENLTAIDSNTDAEIMNSVVAEYLSKDPEGSPVSEALQEEISQKQASEKTVEVTISVSEMSEESFDEETIKEANSCCSNLAPEKVVTEETSLQEGQLDDKPLRGLDTSAAEKTLSTNTTTECSLQDEEVDSMKVEETSELMSRLPTLACESADKEGKTVERPHADVVEEPRGTSDTVSESREQCVENFVEIQESLTLENSEDNIVKKEIKGPADGVSECTNQSFEAATENEVTADQTIEAEKPEEQLQEMSAALVSEEQEHGISTITRKLEDENTVENETPQYENPQDSFGTKITEERCLHKEESRDLEVYELELNNDVQKKTSSEEPKEGSNALYRITPLEPLEDAFEIKCRDSLAESNMELTRSMDSTLQEASNDDEDLDSGISIKNVNGVLPPCPSGEEILPEVEENSEEATNLEGEEGKEIEKVSESTFQVHSAEVDKIAIELEAGSHSHGSEPSSVENNNNPTEKNIELAELGEKLGGEAELVAEDQCTETRLETNQTQVNGNRSAYEQYTKSIEEQLTGHKERETETMEETEGKLEFRDHINVVQNEDVTTKDFISVEEVPKEAEIAEEKENIQEQIIEEKIDTKELAAVFIEDKTVVDKVQHSEPVSCESYRATESNKETKEVNLEVEEDPCEKQADVSSSVFELSEKGEILDEADNDNKLDTACKKEEAEKTIFQEPQLDDEPLKGTEAILEEKIPSIINTTETSPGVEEAEAVKLEKTSDLVSQFPTTTYEHADKERVIVEKPQADEVEEIKRASDAVSESKDPCVEEIEQTQRSLTMEKLEEEIIEEEMPGRSRTVSACNQSVEAIFQDEITRESPETGNSVDQLQELATPLLPEEEEHADKNPQKENLEDTFGTESVEEISLQKEGLRELEVSALATKLSDVIQKETPNEVLEDEGQTQENAPEIKYMGSTTGSEEVMKLTRSINSSSQETLKEEEILDSESSNNKAGDFSITHSSGENLPKMQEQCEKTPILESKMIEKASESVSEVHYPEVVIKLEETEVKEEHLKTSVAEMKTEEIPHEKKIEANEIIKNEISNEEIAEEKQVAKDYQPESLDKETIRKSQQGDELKNEAEHEELSEGSKKGEASENIEKQIIDEARTVEHPPLVSFRNESVKDDLLEEAKEERNDKETDIKLDLVNQSDETALSEQADCSDIQLVMKDLNIVDAHDDKEIVITKDDDLKPNLDVQPATRAAAEEASHQKEGDRIREVSESAPQEPVHERCNEETATAITDYSENIMEDKMHTHTPSELACKEQYVSEGLNLKDLEVSTNENGTSPFSETSWEEIPDKESVISEAERQHDLTSGEQTIAASMPTEEKGAKDDGEHTKDEEPIEFSARGRKGKLEEADIHSKTCHKDGEIQDQIDKLNASSQVQDSCMEISEKEVNVDLAEANESTQDIKKLEKGSDETSQKRIPSEAELNESTEVMVSSSKEEVQPVAKDLQPEVGSLESGNVSSIETGAGAKDLGGEKTMGDISEEPAVDPTPPGPAVSFSNLLQRSIKETLQAPGCLTEEKEQTVNKEDALAKEEEGSDVQEAKTLEDRDKEEERGEQKKDDPGSDAPIIIEASRDMNAKDGHKKSHNILSGVGSKVKHSIAKVKKAITGKSSHQKHSSPKGTATKVKEQK